MIKYIFIFSFCLLLLNSCTSSYPKENLTDSVKKLFKKELDADVETKLVGKTLYVQFQVENLVGKNFDLPKEVIKKLEDAMLSITRISLSTDAEIDYTVIEARDLTWKVQTCLIRRMPDLKGLIYWKVSKQDFDERLVLETKKIVESESETKKWHDITLPEFMGRLVASRISLGTRANPFLTVLLGIERMTSDYHSSNRTLSLIIENSSDMVSSSTSSVSLGLLKDTVSEQIAQAEKKYVDAAPNGTNIFRKKTGGRPQNQNWAAEVLIEDSKGNVLLRIPREEWLHLKK